MEHYDYTSNHYPSSSHQRQHNFSRSLSSRHHQPEQYPQGYVGMEPYTVNPSEYATRGNHYSDYNNGLQEAYPSHLDPSHHHLARGHSHHSTHGRYHEDLTHAMPGSYPAHSAYDRVPYNPHSGNHKLHHPYPDRRLGPIEPQQSVPNSLFQEHPASFRSPSPIDIIDDMSILNRPVTPSRTYSLGRQSYRSQYHHPDTYGQSYHPSGMSYSRSSSPRDSNFYYSSRGSYDDTYIDQPPYNGNYYTTPHYYGHSATYNGAIYPNSGVAGAYPTIVPLNGGAGGYVVMPQAGQNVQVIDASGKTSHMAIHHSSTNFRDYALSSEAIIFPYPPHTTYYRISPATGIRTISTHTMGKSKQDNQYYVQSPTPAYHGPPGVYAEPQYGPYAPPPGPMAQAYSSQPMYQSQPPMTVIQPGPSRRNDDGCCTACCACLLGVWTALCCCPFWII
ncbi:hypothetical protein CVT24_005511 [Panaeolus cyanescens]|uniref:Uncharacterized protein n=1 Tax=Panaeolus cyanescens TaxID=181874 RepID=A0A409YBZ3_9AGAR|nr:hypothetical protein CVT24_005511 [Panaeolus cyanescens]